MLLALAFGLCQAQWQNRQLLTGFSSAHDLMIEHEPSLVAPTQSLLSLPQAKTQRLSNYESFGDADHHRRLMQFSRVPAPAPSPVSFNQHGEALSGLLPSDLFSTFLKTSLKSSDGSKELETNCMLLRVPMIDTLLACNDKIYLEYL